MEGVLENVVPWAQEVFLVDSYSTDATVDIALKHGVYVVQRKFTGFGDQWNFAMQALPIRAPWTMKLDPDERLTNNLKRGICEAIREDDADGLSVRRRLWFMGRRMPVRQELLRVWRTGTCQFSDVLVNEQPLVNGRIRVVAAELEHYDSPNLHHWYEKQNRYTTTEALASFRRSSLSAEPRLLGTSLEQSGVVQTTYPSFAIPIFQSLPLSLFDTWCLAGRTSGPHLGASSCRGLSRVGLQGPRNADHWS